MTALEVEYSEAESYRDSFLGYIDTITIGNRANGIDSAESNIPYYEIVVDSALTRGYIDGGMVFYSDSYDYYLNVFEYAYSDYSTISEDTTIEEYAQMCIEDFDTIDTVEITDTELKTTDNGNYYLEAKQTEDDGTEVYICMVYNQCSNAFWETWFCCDYNKKDDLQPTFNQLADTITFE